MRVRTGYSFRTAVGEIGDVMARIVECGWKFAPITDRASTFGWVRWEKAAKSAGLTPIFGVELAVADDINEKKPTVDFWTFIAKDDVASVNRLVSLATQQFRYQPLLTYDDAARAEGVIKIVGRRADFSAFERDTWTYYGLAPSCSKGHVRQAIELGFPMVAVSDNFFPREQDLGFYEVAIGRDASRQTYDQFIQTDEEWIKSVRHLAPALQVDLALPTRSVLFNSAKAQLERAEIVHPERPASLLALCEEAAPRLGVPLADPFYRARLDKELALIEEKKFEDYFYIVSDLCKWARPRMAVGPARGSSCGSLVCYLLEITTVDPIPHGLIFERFIDVNRADLPDIDIDFSDQQRHLVFEYLSKRYGQERVARLGVVAMYKARSALQEAGAALKVPRWQCDAVVDSLIERSSGDSRVNDTLEDTLKSSPAGKALLDSRPEIMIAARMEGHPRHYSQHAAGVVIASRPITNYVAVDHRTGATMCDKEDAEKRLGLLKIDALGLTQLSIFEDALRMIGKTMSDLQTLPLDDQAAFDVLNRGEFSGVFQWNGGAVQSLTKNVKVSEFSDIASISALARPGPLATGGATQWVRRRMGAEAQGDQHPLLAAQTKETYGVVIYQETVMNICRQIGNFSWADTAAIRKLMSSRAGNEKFAKFELQFISGAKQNGMDETTAKTIWDQINTFGSWAFNKSHAVAYAYISYWCCWFKAHHPLEFAAATLSHESDADKQIHLLRELKAEGIDYLPVDAKLSGDKWTVSEIKGRRVLVGPLSNVKGIGPALVNAILGARARGEPLPSRAAKLLANPVTSVDSLTPVADAFRRVLPDPSARNIITRPTPIGSVQPSEKLQEVLFFCVPSKVNPRDENEEINVLRRGYRIEDGLTESLSLKVFDDTGTMLAKVNRFKFKRLAGQILENARVNASLWALKGRVVTVGTSMLVLSIDDARYIGEMES